MSIKPQQFAIYKGMSSKWGGLQFNFNPPHYYCSNNKCRTKNYDGVKQLCSCSETAMLAREGNVFVDIASATGPNVYDWENKIVMALSITDLTKLLNGLRSGTEVRLLHDPGIKTEFAGKRQKIFQFSSPKGIEAGGIITISEKNDMDNKEPHHHTVPLSFDEVVTLGILIQSVIPKCLGWT